MHILKIEEGYYPTPSRAVFALCGALVTYEDSWMLVGSTWDRDSRCSACLDTLDPLVLLSVTDL